MQFTAQYDVTTMQTDMTAKGWLVMDLARKADISHMTVARFFEGRHQTARTAKKIAKALGHSVRRYIVSAESTAVAS